MDHQRSLARPLIPDPLLGHGAFVAHAMIAFFAIALAALTVAALEASLLGSQSLSALEVADMMANRY
jgi:hypothetical protein